MTSYRSCLLNRVTTRIICPTCEAHVGVRLRPWNLRERYGYGVQLIASHSVGCGNVRPGKPRCDASLLPVPAKARAA